MNYKKGFIPSLLLALIAILVVGWAYLYVHNKSVNQNAAVQTSDLKTYSNARYGFEFNYPAAWIVTETKTDRGNSLVGYIVKLTSPHEVSITVSFSDPQKDSANCPVGAHEIECKELENANGFRYTRTISTGQLQYDKQKQLNGYFVASNMHGQMSSLLTDISGNPLPFSAETVAVFDGILQSMKFTVLTTSNAQSEESKSFLSRELGISLNYPQGWLISTSTRSQSLIDYATKHPEFSYADINVYKDNYRVSIYVTTDPSQGGSSVLERSGVPTGKLGLTIAGHQAWRDSKPDLCADVEQPQPDGLCYHISFLNEQFVPFGGYSAGSINQIVKQNRRYIFTFFVPNVPDESIAKKLDRIVESIQII